MKNNTSLLNITILVSALTIIGKILGFGREALIASLYGATAETDAFFFAQAMPGTIFPAVCSSTSTAFMTLYVGRITDRGENEGDLYASRMINASAILGVFLGILGVILAPFLVSVFAPGFSGSQLTLSIHLTQLTMGAFVLTMLQYMAGAILNARRCFISTQTAALVYNIVIIALLFLFGKNQGMEMLTLTVIFGMLMQVLLLFSCLRTHFHYTPRLNPFHSDTAELFRLALPILLGNSVVQLNNIVDKALGSLQPEGSLSALSYASSLDALVVSIFVTSLSTVLYPTLTSMAAGSDQAEYGKTLLQSLSGLTLVLFPISCITLLAADDVVNIVYARGSFDQTAVAYTSVVLACYAPQFLFVGIREVLTRGFFALQDTKTPSINSAVGVGCNIVFSLVFVRWLGLRGIAIGTTLSALVSALMLLRATHVRLPELHLSSFYRQLGLQAVSGCALVLALAVFRHFSPLTGAFVRFAVSTILGFSVYFLTILLIDRNGSRNVLSALCRRLKK